MHKWDNSGIFQVIFGSISVPWKIFVFLINFIPCRLVCFMLNVIHLSFALYLEAFRDALWDGKPSCPFEITKLKMLIKVLNICICWLMPVYRLVQERMCMSFQNSFLYLWQRMIRGRSYRHLMQEVGYNK